MKKVILLLLFFIISVHAWEDDDDDKCCDIGQCICSNLDTSCGTGNTCINCAMLSPPQECRNGVCTCIPGTIKFDDLRDLSLHIPNGYACLDWTNVYMVPKTYLPGSGYDHGTVSLPNVAYNGDGLLGTITGSPFKPISVYATAAWNNGLVATFTGSLSGSTVGTVVVILNTNNPLFIDLTSLGTIDTLTFVGTGGTNCRCGSGSGPHIALDNLTIL